MNSAGLLPHSPSTPGHSCRPFPTLEVGGFEYLRTVLQARSRHVQQERGPFPPPTPHMCGKRAFFDSRYKCSKTKINFYQTTLTLLILKSPLKECFETDLKMKTTLWQYRYNFVQRRHLLTALLFKSSVAVNELFSMPFTTRSLQSPVR